MLNQKTTFVIGAGASCELGLPSGDGLMQELQDALKTTDETAFRFSDPQILDSLRDRYASLNTVDQAQLRKMADAADRIRRGLGFAQSIDNYLHTHQDDDEIRYVGMGAIAKVILHRERKSPLFQDVNKRPSQGPILRLQTSNENSFPNNMKETWHAQLAKILFSQVGRSNPEEAFRNIEFVIFNYDRCIEEFLWRATQDYFDLTGEEAADLLSEVPFIHPYGSLGALPWQTHLETRQTPFGITHGTNFFEVGESLRTFTESVQSATGAQVASAIKNAKMVVVLGFGFLEQNVRLLVPDRLEQQGPSKVIATVYGIEEPSYVIVKKQIRRLGQEFAEPDQFMIEPGTCNDLFRNFDFHFRF